MSNRQINTGSLSGDLIAQKKHVETSAIQLKLPYTQTIQQWIAPCIADAALYGFLMKYSQTFEAFWARPGIVSA